MKHLFTTILLVILIPLIGSSQENPYCIPITLDVDTNKIIRYTHIGPLERISYYNGDYSDNTDDTITVVAGVTYLIAFSANDYLDYSGATRDYMGYSMWVDWDNDSVFKAGGPDHERIYTNYNSEGYYDGPDLIQFGTIYDQPSIHRLRLRSHYYMYPPHPCDYYMYGECEDYTLKILSNPLDTNDPERPRVNVYPNPSKGTIYVDGLKPDEVVYIHDMLGKLLWQFTGSKVILTNANSGIYILSTSSGITQRIEVIK